jgi:predicted nucleic acid-binding protein
MAYLLDTNILAEVRKSTPDTGVTAWLATVPGDQLYLSVLVVGEIRQGIERLRPRDPKRATVYEAWLATLAADYADRIVPITTDVAETWGRLNTPDPLPVIDGLLAATAIIHGWTLVTRNTRDVARTGVSLLNPFSPST